MAENPQSKYSLDNFPAELRERKLWVLWRLEDSDQRKRCKLPRQVANPQVGADSTDPATWATFQAALAELHNFPPHPLYKDEVSTGVGCVIADGYVGLDLDHCYDEPKAETADWAKQLIAALPPTYTELTPSRSGFHLWYKLAEGVQPPDKKGVRTKCAEVYLTGRYFTVTGWSAKDRAQIHRLSQQELNQLIAAVEATSEKKEPATQAVLKEDQVFALLMNGKLAELGYDPTGDSEADLRLCGLLAKKFNGNRQLIEQVWKSSGLKRDKLGRADYVTRTLDKALENFHAKPEPEAIDPETWAEEFPLLGSYREIPKPTPIVQDLLLQSCIHVFAGLFESYKTMAALEIVSAVRQQRPAFDHFPVHSAPEVLYLCPDMSPSLFFEYAAQFGLAEDSGVRVIRHDADALLQLDDPRLKRAVDGRILVLDTMLDYAHIKDAFQSAEWTAFFQKLRALVKHDNCAAVILIAHPTKAGARNTVIDPTEYLKDSVTFGGKIDVGYGFRKIDDTSKVLIERIKGRGFKKSIRFTITTLDERGNSHLDQGRFPIFDKPDSCESLSAQFPQKTKGRPRGNDGWLPRAQQLLKDGLRKNAIAKTLRDEGFEVSDSTVKRRLKDDQIPF